MPSQGKLEAIWLKPAHRAPLKAVESTAAVAGQGLAGNCHQGGRRQVTLLSADAWDAVVAALGEDVDPRLRRANLYLRGIDLRNSRGRTLRIGSCRVEIGGETRPCRLMDDACNGLQAALDPDWRAGAYGILLDDGELRVGALVSWDDS